MIFAQSNKSKYRLILLGLLHVLAWCLINAIFVFFSYTYLFKTKFIKSLEFVFPIQIGSLTFEFPYIKKKLLPLIFVLGISAVISKIAVDYFEVYKFEYKNVLEKEGLIKKPQAKNQSDAKSDFYKALGIVFLFVSIRNSFREPREIAQFLFNNIERLGFSWVKMIFLSFLIFSTIIFLTFIDKYSKRKENKKCNDLLQKESKQEKKIGKTVNFIAYLKNKAYKLKFLKKHDDLINEIICITISVIPSLFISKFFVSLGVLQNVKLTFNISDAFFSFIDNSNFLITNIFFEFLFASVVASFFFTDNDAVDKSESLKITNQKPIRTIFVSTVNALLFSVGLGSTILIEKSIARIEKFNNFFDIIKVLCALTIGYAMIVSAYTIPKTICEIQDAKEEFIALKYQI